MKQLSTLFLALFTLLSFPHNSQGQAGLDTLSLESIFYDPLLAGNRPDLTTFSPDLSHVYYQSNDSAMSEEKHYQVDLEGKNRESAPDNIIYRYNISPDGKKLAYTEQGDIWLADSDFENKKQLVESVSREYNITWGPNSQQLAYIQDGDVWIIDIDSARLKQVTNKEDDEPNYSIIDWGGENKLILSQNDTSDYEEYYFPEYVDKYVEPGTTRRGISRRIISVAKLDTNVVEELYDKKGYLDTSVSADGNYLAIDAMGPPMKKRTTRVYDFEKDKWATVFEDSTDGWLFGTDLAFAPKGKKLLIQSEKDGWNHIYTVDVDGSNLQQHTNGSFEVPWAEWIDGNSVVFASTEVDPGERHVYKLDINNSHISKLTHKTGYRQDFELSRDKQHLVYEYSYFNEPFELYALNLEDPEEETRLTQTIPDRFTDIDWQQEDYIRFTGRNSETQLSMSVLEPQDLDGQNPVVVFVHGAGSLQNVYKGWSNNYYREYMFHQYLNARGYYVIEVDYRHSTGYGRDFREDVTNWMGKYETQDIVDGIEYLAEHYPEADTSNVGIYGGSYGGFMALYATSTEPSYFDAAAALRAVTNWENYYHTNPWYTRPRLGTPEEDSTHFERSSPISYVDELEDPVLILHGLIDNNVGFQDAAQYIDELISADNKDFDMMIYPSERHSFNDADAWHDEYRRIYKFFEEHLRSTSSTVTPAGTE